MREYQVRICERLGVKFPGPTRQEHACRRPRRHGVSASVTGRNRCDAEDFGLVPSLSAVATALRRQDLDEAVARAGQAAPLAVEGLGAMSVARWPLATSVLHEIVVAG